MKKIVLLFSLLVSFVPICHAVTGESISKYHLKEYNTVEEFQEAYLNKVISYAPIGSAGYRQQMNLNFSIRNFIVTSITGKTKKGKDTQDMEWTIKEVDDIVTRTFIVHSGNYNKKIREINENREFLFRDLQFYNFDEWKEEHKSEIGKQFEDPMVKAKYVVTDVSLSVAEDPEKYKRMDVFKMYTVKNSISGEESTYVADKAHILCFREDRLGKYVSTLAKVEKPSNPSVKFGKTTTVLDEGITKYSYEDNFISIIIFGTATQFSFILKNVSETTQKLIWDEAVYVDYKGSTSKVMHSGIKYSQREASQPPSIIIKGASLDDIAVPTANVYYNDILNEWSLKSMYPNELRKETMQAQLMLPIQIKDVINEYIFVFDIKFTYNHPERLNLPE